LDAADRNELPGRRRDFRNGRNEVEGEFPLPPLSPPPPVIRAKGIARARVTA